MSYDKSELWKTFSKECEKHPELIQGFTDTREIAEDLTNEIRIDLKDFTVHNIKHLDALWTVADQIIGDDLKLNPL